MTTQPMSISSIRIAHGQSVFEDGFCFGRTIFAGFCEGRGFPDLSHTISCFVPARLVGCLLEFLTMLRRKEEEEGKRMGFYTF